MANCTAPIYATVGDCIVCGYHGSEQGHHCLVPDGTYEFFVDWRPVVSNKPSLSVLEIRCLYRPDAFAYEVFMETPRGDVRLGNGNGVDLRTRPSLYFLPPARMYR